MMLYAEQRFSELTELKKRRETHIQAMYDQLESLWRRMGVDDAAMDAFVEVSHLNLGRDIRLCMLAVGESRDDSSGYPSLRGRARAYD